MQDDRSRQRRQGSNGTSPRDSYRRRSGSRESVGRVGMPGEPESSQTTALARRSSSELRHLRAYADRYYRRSRVKMIAIVAAVVVATIAIVVKVATFAYAGAVDEKLHRGLLPETTAALVAPASDEVPYYLLIIGVDDSSTDDLHAGCLMLARINPQEGKACLVSIPTDTYIELEGANPGTIGQTYAQGGAAMTLRAVSWLAGVDIAHYAEIRESGLAALVDGVGGLDLKVPEAIADSSAGGMSIEAGEQKLDGQQIAYLSRAQAIYADGAASKMANQRAILTALLREVSSHRLINLAREVDAISEQVCTDMDSVQVRSLAHRLHGLDVSADVSGAAVPCSYHDIGGTIYPVSNTDAWQPMMERVNSGQTPTGEESSQGSISIVSPSVVASVYKIDVQNGSGVSGCGQEAADKLSAAAYQIGELGNANAFGYSKTLIVYADSGRLPVAESVAHALGLGDVVSASQGDYTFSGDVLVVVGKDWIP